MTHIQLMQQTGTLRVTFGLSRDAEAPLEQPLSGRLTLLSVVRCRNASAATRVLQMLHERYQAYQDGGWYTMPAGEVSDLLFWFRAMSTAVSTRREYFYQQLGGMPAKKHPRSQFTQAVAWLQDHDPDCTLPIRTIAARAGVSTGTAHSAVRHLLALKETG